MNPVTTRNKAPCIFEQCSPEKKKRTEKKTEETKCARGSFNSIALYTATASPQSMAHVKRRSPLAKSSEPQYHLRSNAHLIASHRDSTTSGSWLGSLRPPIAVVTHLGLTLEIYRLKIRVQGRSWAFSWARGCTNIRKYFFQIAHGLLTHSELIRKRPNKWLGTGEQCTPHLTSAPARTCPKLALCLCIQGTALLSTLTFSPVPHVQS